MPNRQRMFIVRRGEAGRPLADLLRSRFRLAPKEVEDLLRNHRVWVNGRPCGERKWRVLAGQRVRIKFSDGQAPHAASRATGPQRAACPHHTYTGPPPIIRYADAHVVVVDKPAGLTTVRHADEAAEFGARARRFLPPTLADLLPGLLKNERQGASPQVRAVHRLDKDTSGLVVFARTAEAESNLGRQFRAHAIERAYLAVVRGKAEDRRIESWLMRDRGDGRRGSSPQQDQGQRAVTHLRVKERLGDFTLVECRLETGRTHQVRIHLAETGTPICGERVYDRPPNGRPAPDGSGATRIALHAASLGFEHPTTGKRRVWHSPPPKDMAQLVARLRARS